MQHIINANENNVKGMQVKGSMSIECSCSSCGSLGIGINAHDHLAPGAFGHESVICLLRVLEREHRISSRLEFA